MIQRNKIKNGKEKRISLKIHRFQSIEIIHANKLKTDEIVDFIGQKNSPTLMRKISALLHIK